MSLGEVQIEFTGSEPTNVVFHGPHRFAEEKMRQLRELLASKGLSLQVLGYEVLHLHQYCECHYGQPTERA